MIRNIGNINNGRLFSEKGYFDILRDAINNHRPTHLYISSPWINAVGLAKLKEALGGYKPKEVQVVIRASEFKDLDITPPEVFRELKNLAKKVEIRISRNVHAKLILGEREGEKNHFVILTSSNLTGAGFHTNAEAGIFLLVDGGSYKHFKKIFNEIYKEASPIEDVVGMVINPSKPYSLEFALFQDIPQDSWVRVEMGDGDSKGWLLARVDRVLKWNRSFFLNPFTQGYSPHFQAPEEMFKTFEVPDHHREGALEWHIARGQALVGTTPDIPIATAYVLAYVKGGTPETPRIAPPVGSIVKRITKEDFEKVFYSNRINSKEDYVLGYAISADEKEKLPFYLDFEEIMGKHMAVHGATGSGKSYFAKLFVSKVWRYITDNGKPYGIIILDPHGEYVGPSEDLEKVGFPKANGRTVKMVKVDIPQEVEIIAQQYQIQTVLQNIPQPNQQTSGSKQKSKIKEILKKINIVNLDNRNENGKRNNLLFDVLESMYNDTIAALFLIAKKLNLLSPQDIHNILVQGMNPNNAQNLLMNKIQNHLNTLRKNLQAASSPNYLNDLENALNGLKNSQPFLLVLNMKDIDDAEDRVKVAAEVMEKVYRWMKENGEGKIKILLVMDEAHNFAGGAHGETSRGKDNPAVVWARRIATEGRKFGLGLVLISQRVRGALDNTVRSQCNTVVLFRLVNNNDIGGARDSYEGVSSEITYKLPSLHQGEAFVSGVAIRYPIIVKVGA